MKYIGIGVAALMFASVSQAALLVEDKFIDSGFTDGSDAKDLNWQLYTSGPTLSIVSDNTTGPNEGGNDNALNVDNSGQGFRGVYGILGSSFTLGVGDKLVLTYDMQFQGTPAYNSAGIRFGLYNSNGTNAATNDTGYFGRLSIGTGTAVSEVWKETGAEVILSGGDTALVAGGSGSGYTSVSTNSVTLGMVLTRTGLSALKIELTQGVSTVWSVTDSSATYFTYDEIALGTGTNTVQFRLDNITLNTVVPEPATAGLLAIGTMLLGRRRRI